MAKSDTFQQINEARARGDAELSGAAARTQAAQRRERLRVADRNARDIAPF